MLPQSLERLSPISNSCTSARLQRGHRSCFLGLLPHSSPHSKPPQKQEALQPSHCQPPTQQELKAGARAYLPQFPQQLIPHSGKSLVQVLLTLLDYSRFFQISPVQFHPNAHFLQLHLRTCPNLGQTHSEPWAQRCHTLSENDTPESGRVICACNPGTQETKSGRS